MLEQQQPPVFEQQLHVCVAILHHGVEAHLVQVVVLPPLSVHQLDPAVH